MPGMIWNPRVSPANRLPATAVPAVGGCFDSNALEAVQFSDQNRVGGQRARVLSIPVPNGFYWWVLLATIINTDPNQQSHDLFLVEPTYATLGPNTFFPDFSTPDGFHKISPDTAQLSQGLLTQSGRGVSPIQHFPVIVVPSRWAIAVAEMNSVISGITRTLHLRLMRAQINNGAPPPF